MGATMIWTPDTLSLMRAADQTRTVRAWATECDDNGPDQCESCGHVEHDDGCKNADLTDDLIGVFTTWGENENT